MRTPVPGHVFSFINGAGRGIQRLDVWRFGVIICVRLQGRYSPVRG